MYTSFMVDQMAWFSRLPSFYCLHASQRAKNDCSVCVLVHLSVFFFSFFGTEWRRFPCCEDEEHSARMLS